MERDFFHTFRFFSIGYFNSHAHVERDAVCEQEIKGYFNFNSHAHVERDVLVKSLSRPHGNFNSHAHVERDTP